MTMDLETGEADAAFLMYHRVCRDEAPPSSAFVVSARVFREQLRHLARARCFTPRLSDVLSGQVRPPRPGMHPVVITFDDGYLDSLEVALPILQELGFTAALFPVLGQRARTTWWAAEPALHAPLLSPAALRTLEAEGVELGSHTLDHPRLTRLGDRALREELVRSREALGAIARQPLDVLAYPYGDVDVRVKQAAREAGYGAGLAVHTGPLGLADRYEIRRYAVSNTASAVYLSLALSGAGQLYRWLKWKARETLHGRNRASPPPPALEERDAPGGKEAC